MGNHQGTHNGGARSSQQNEDTPDDPESLPQLKRGFSLRRSRRLSKRFRSHKSECCQLSNGVIWQIYSNFKVEESLRIGVVPNARASLFCFRLSKQILLFVVFCPNIALPRVNFNSLALRVQIPDEVISWTLLDDLSGGLKSKKYVLSAIVPWIIHTCWAQ